MVSRLHPRTLNHFRHLTISNSSFSEFLSWNPPVWLGTLHFGAPGPAGEEKAWHHFYSSFASLWVLVSFHFPRLRSQKPVLSWHSWAPQIPPFGLGENELGVVAEKAALWLFSSCQACQNLQVFPVSALVPGRMKVGGRKGKREWKAGSGILGSQCFDPYPFVLLWIPQYKKPTPITDDPHAASTTQQQQRLIKTERVPILSFVFAQCLSLTCV